MKISIHSIVSNSDMIKNYKTCREKAEASGKIFIFKNNQPDAVLFSIGEYGKVAAFIEFTETHGEEDVAKLIKSFSEKSDNQAYPAGQPLGEPQ